MKSTFPVLTHSHLIHFISLAVFLCCYTVLFRIDAHPGCHTKPSSTKVSTTHDTNDASLMGIMESSSVCLLYAFMF